MGIVAPFPFPFFTDQNGSPLDDGYVYFGETNQNPQTTPISIYWDADCTVTAAQPVRTSGGYLYRNGSPARIYTTTDYSITVRNRSGVLVCTAATSGNAIWQPQFIQTYGPPGLQSTLENAFDILGDDEMTLMLSPVTWEITDDLTIPENITLYFPRGAVFDVALNKQVFVESPGGIEAGPYRIFTFDKTYTFTSYPLSGSRTYKMPVSYTVSGAIVQTAWWGAVAGTEADETDTISRAAIQAAIDSIWRRGTVRFQQGVYWLDNGYRYDYLGKKCALWYTNDYNAYGHTDGANFRPSITLEGGGLYSTLLTTNQSYGHERILGWYANGEGGTISRLGFTFVQDSGSTIGDCMWISGNGNQISECYTGGGVNGQHHFSGGGDNVWACWSEFDEYAFLCDEAFGTAFNQCDAYQPTEAGFKIEATAAGIAGGLPSDAVMWDGIQLTGCKASNIPSSGIGLHINVEQASFLTTQDTGCYWGTNGFTTSVHMPGAMVGLYSALIEATYDHTSNGSVFSHTKNGTLVNSTTAAKFSSCTFARTGMYDQSAAIGPCRALQLDAGSNVEVTNCTFIDNAGPAIYSRAARLLVNGGRYINNCNGGLDASNDPVNAVNTTLGDKVIWLVPAATTDRAHFTKTDHYKQSTYNAGITGLYIDCSGFIPAAGNIEFVGNNMETASYATPFGSTGVTAPQRNVWLSTQDDFLPTTPIVLPSWADTDVPNNRMYFSTTGGTNKPGWKDGAGVFNAFY